MNSDKCSSFSSTTSDTLQNTSSHIAVALAGQRHVPMHTTLGNASEPSTACQPDVPRAAKIAAAPVGS